MLLTLVVAPARLFGAVVSGRGRIAAAQEVGGIKASHLFKLVGHLLSAVRVGRRGSLVVSRTGHTWATSLFGDVWCVFDFALLAQRPTSSLLPSTTSFLPPVSPSYSRFSYPLALACKCTPKSLPAHPLSRSLPTLLLSRCPPAYLPPSRSRRSTFFAPDCYRRGFASSLSPGPISGKPHPPLAHTPLLIHSCFPGQHLAFALGRPSVPCARVVSRRSMCVLSAR